MNKRKTVGQKLTEKQVAKNCEAARQALANMQLSGFKFTQENLDFYNKIIVGEITTTEAIEMWNEKYKSGRSEN